MNTFEKIIEIINQCTERNNEIDYDTSISADLGISSLEFFEIICSIEEIFHIKVDDSQISRFRKVSDLVAYVEENAASQKDDLTVHTCNRADSQKRATNSERATAIDIAKAICMLGLPFIHSINHYVIACNMVDFGKFNPELLLTLTALGPGVFLICMGYDIQAETPYRKLFSDGILLILIGFILNIIRFLMPYTIMLYLASTLSAEKVIGLLLGSDIYYIAGLFYVVLAFLRKLKLSDSVVFAVSVLMLAANTIITGIDFSVDNVLISQVMGNLFYVDADSIFPILGWAIFPVVGIFLARNPLEKLSRNRLLESLACFIAVLVALTASLRYFGLDIYSITVNPNNDYIIETFNAIMQICLVLIFLYVLQLILVLTRQNAVENLLKKLSYYLMPFYCIHWIIIEWIGILLVALFYKKPPMSIWMFGLIIAMITVASLFISVKFGMKLMRFMIRIASPIALKAAGKSTEKSGLREKTLHELVKLNGAYDSAAYMEFEGDGIKKLSRKALKQQAVLVAGYLVTNGYENEKIAVFCDKSIDWAIVFYGITYGRNTAVLFNPELPIDTLLEELVLSDCVAIFYPEEAEEKIKLLSNRYPSARTILSFAELIQNAQTANTRKAAFSAPAENDIAAMLFSSGTTGVPKCVQLTHRNLVSNTIAINTMCAEYDWGGPHNTVVVLPVYHAFSLTISVLCPLYNGGSAVFNQNMTSIVSDIRKFRPDYLALVPQLTKVLAKLASAEEGDSLREKMGGSVKYIFCGGATMPEELRQLYKDSGIRLCNGYGITECSPLVSGDLNNYGADGCLGRLIPGVKVRISDEGEIQVKGENVTPGYYNNPEANKESFEEGWFRTGDIGEINPDGSLKFVGRLKNLIILSNGENISAERIENVISSYPNILALKVFEESNHLAVEIYPDWSVPDVEKSIRESINLANDNLPGIWKICAVYFRKEDFARTANGKIIACQ